MSEAAERERCSSAALQAGARPQGEMEMRTCGFPSCTEKSGRYMALRATWSGVEAEKAPVLSAAWAFCTKLD